MKKTKKRSKPDPLSNLATAIEKLTGYKLLLIGPWKIQSWPSDPKLKREFVVEFLGSKLPPAGDGP